MDRWAVKHSFTPTRVYLPSHRQCSTVGGAGRNRKYVSLDDLNLREMAWSAPKLFLQLHKPPVLIDEVQYTPELFTYIKIHIDESHNPGDFWLTGSQIFRLMQDVQESLAGWVAPLHMSPLSQRELEGLPCVPFTTDFEVLTQQSELARWSSPEIAESGAMNGALPENYTVSEIVKGYRNAGLEPCIHYCRDRDAKEIDVILEGDGKLCPLEIKKTATPDKRLVRDFGVPEKAPLQIGTSAILCLADQLGAFDRKNLIVPIWMIQKRREDTLKKEAPPYVSSSWPPM